MKVASIVGARPQFVKAGVVCRAFQKISTADHILIHTGQHYDENMSEVFFDQLEIPRPTYNLDIGSGSHGAQTGRMLEAIERILETEKPDWVVVYGDTNSTLAGALASSKLHIPVAHVEAGLRSFNRRMPEEINRVLTDHVSSLLFAPTETAVKNLRDEGISGDSVRLVGDVMYDAARFYAQRSGSHGTILTELKISPGTYVLTTVHRAENTDDPTRLESIVKALGKVAESIPVIFPVHPRTKKLLSDLLSSPPIGLFMIEPVGYLEMVSLEKNAKVIATDSGGVQKEAFFYGVPCITLRNETEWVELIDSGWNQLAPPGDERDIAEKILTARVPMNHPALYGTGASAEQIVESLEAFDH